MSDTSKGLQRTDGLRWIFLGAALLLTVVALALGWIETVDRLPAAPRSIVWGVALVSWVGTIQAWCTGVVLKRQKKIEKEVKEQIDDNTNRIIAAVVEKRLGELADLLESNNVRSINERRR